MGIVKYLLQRPYSWVLTIATIILFVMATTKPTIPTGVYELSYPVYFGNRITIPKNNPLTKQGVYLGRMLFYEPMLSSTNTISCATCHQQKLAFTDGKAFSEGVDGTFTNRNSMSLTNLLWVRSFFWDGRVRSLEDQAKIPISDPHEMNESLENISKKLQETKLYPSLFKSVFGTKEISGDRIVKAISQFERTLISANSPYDKYLRGEYKPTEQELNGLQLFMTNPQPVKGIRGANCGFCHGTPKMYMEVFHNNGLDTIPIDLGRENITGLLNDKGRFRVATLRNIAITAPYMHDGRFKTLKEVLDHYNEHIKASPFLSQFLQYKSNDLGGKRLRLTEQEKKDIISFLKLLTDSTFITDSRFSNPHLYESETQGTKYN